MTRTYDVAVCDSSSLSGETLIRVLEEKNFPVGTLYPLSDSVNAGASIEFCSQELDILTESGFEYADVELVFVPPNSVVREGMIAQAIESGCIIIDGSWGAALSGADVILPGLNEGILEDAVMRRHVVIPSSPAAMVLPVLQTIHEMTTVSRVDIIACQPVSRQGNPGIDELKKQTVELLSGKPSEGKVFPHRIAYNLIPQVGAINESGMSTEEIIMATEIAAGLHVSDIDVRATCVLVPVFYGDSLCVSVDTDCALDLDVVREALDSITGITLCKDDYATAEQAAGADDVMIGRLRQLPDKTCSVCFWLSADAIRQSAISAMTVAEMLIKGFL